MLLIPGILAGVVLFFTALAILILCGRGFPKRSYLKYISLFAGRLLLFFFLKFAIGLLDQLGI
jgi:hypothetical protein